MRHTCITFFILGQLLLTISLNGQTTRFLERNAFFGLKDDELLSDQKTYEKITVDSHIITFRRFHPHTFAIAEEYIRYQKDTFLYRAYADTAHHVIAEGLVIYSNDYTITDTVVSFDPETYEEVFTITRYRNPLRSGFWRLETPDVYESGHYQNNVKTGEWFVREKQGFLGKYVYFGDDGRVVSEEPENVVATNDVEKIKQAMEGIWGMEYRSTDQNIYLRKYEQLKEVRAHDEGFIFSSDTVQLVLYLRCATGFDFEGYRKNQKGPWRLEDNNIVSMQIFRYAGKKYQIQYLSRYQMTLKRVANP